MANRPEIQYIQFYIDGTAAKQLDPVAPEKSSAKPAKKSRTNLKRIYIDPVAIIGIMVSVMLLITMTVGVFQLKQAREQNNAMAVCVAQLRLENRDLQENYTEAINLDKVYKQAMALGMIPASEAKVSTILLSAPPVEEAPVTLWQQVSTFLSSLFA